MLDDCIERNSSEALFQENIYHNLFLNRKLKYQSKDVLPQRNFNGYIPELTIVVGRFKYFVEIRRHK